MLTIKHIDTAGIERLYEAEAVKVVRNRGIGEDGIYLDPIETYDRPLAREEAGAAQMVMPAQLSFKHCIPFALCRSSDDTPPRVFVMNRYGSTVATYDL